MMTRLMTAAVVLLTGTATWGEPIMDAADLNLDGSLLVHPCVRLIVDNSAGTEDLSGVSWRIINHGPGYIRPLAFPDWQCADNPWRHTEVAPLHIYIDEGLARLKINLLTYSDNDINRALDLVGVVKPIVSKEYLPGHPLYREPDPEIGYWPENEIEWAFGVIPAGFKFDLVLQILTYADGVRADLFSVAESNITIDGITTTLLDSDPMPQTAAIPEPTTAGLLAIGAASVLTWRRRREGTR